MSEGEESRRRILKAREENKRIAQLIMEGTSHYEMVEVRGLDRQTHKFAVYPLSDGNLAELLNSTGVDLEDIGNKNKLSSNMQFLQKGAALVTGVDDVGKVLMPLESLKLILKAFELSGLTGAPKAV